MKMTCFPIISGQNQGPREEYYMIYYIALYDNLSLCMYVILSWNTISGARQICISAIFQEVVCTIAPLQPH